MLDQLESLEIRQNVCWGDCGHQSYLGIVGIMCLDEGLALSVPDTHLSLPLAALSEHFLCAGCFEQLIFTECLLCVSSDSQLTASTHLNLTTTI